MSRKANQQNASYLVLMNLISQIVLMSTNKKYKNICNHNILLVKV